MYIHWHTRRGEREGIRWWLTLGGFEFRGQMTRTWRSGFIATCGYGGQEDFFEWTVAFSKLFFVHIAVDTPFRWHRFRPFDGKYGEAKRKVGLRSVGGKLSLLLGHDAMGTHYGTYRRGGILGRYWCDLRRNQEVTLFDMDWILGKPRHSMTVLEENIPIVVNVGQWEGDSYTGTAKHTRRQWKRRFSTKVSDGYEVDMREGIPFPGKGENPWDCGDDAYFGFGGETIEGAIEHIIGEVKRRRGENWRPSEASS